jgi:hypothetical protein
MNHFRTSLGNTIYLNPTYQHVIPKVLGNWKVTLTSFLIKKPVDSVLKSVNEIKQKLESYDKLIALQVR